MWTVIFSVVREEELKSHMVAGHRDVNHQCNECEFATVKRERVRIHVEAVHRDGDNQC